MICATKIKKKTKTEVIGCSNDCYLNNNDNTKMCKNTKDLNCTLVIKRLQQLLVDGDLLARLLPPFVLIISCVVVFMTIL